MRLLVLIFQCLFYFQRTLSTFQNKIHNLKACPQEHRFQSFGKTPFIANEMCTTVFEILIITYSMKQPDLYYFETIKMTSQAWSNFVWRIRAAGEYSL